MRHGKRGRAATVSAAVPQEWADVQAQCLWPDQALYELVRPVVLLGKPIRERARETGVSEKTLSRRTHQFIQHGPAGFRAPPGLRDDDGRLLSSAVRDFILVRKAEWPALSAFALARLCAVRFDRETSYRTVARLLAREPLPSGVARRFPRYSEISDPEERRLAVIRLHAEGWTDTNIAQYLSVSRQTVHSTLRRWVEEGVAGLADKPHVRKRPRKTTLPVMATIRELQENPGLGAFRMHAALKQLGIALSPATCGRIMALNRKLYDLATVKPVPKPRKPMPFAATRPHQFWSVDIRYIERHNVPEYAQQPLYIITILETTHAPSSRAPHRQPKTSTPFCWYFSLRSIYMALYMALRRRWSPTVVLFSMPTSPSRSTSVWVSARSRSSADAPTKITWKPTSTSCAGWPITTLRRPQAGRSFAQSTPSSWLITTGRNTRRTRIVRRASARRARYWRGFVAVR